MSEVIVITSGKGGVGKTTTTANVGTGLAMLNKKVVMIDTDIGLRNLDVVLGLENRIVYNLVDVIEGKCRLKQALIKHKKYPELCLLPSAQTRDKSHPLKVVRRGLRIGIINFTYGTNLGSEKHWPKTNYMNEKSLIQDALTKAADCDLTIVLPHWGTEYELKHSKSQEEMAMWLADNGADIIIGAHPHVPQDAGTISPNNVPVAYSLGNGVSNMSAPNTQLELMATIRFIRNEDGSTRLLPIKFTYLWCSRPGGFSSSYTVVPIKKYIGKKHLWKGGWDYDKMITTYQRVKDIIGIEDN